MKPSFIDVMEGGTPRTTAGTPLTRAEVYDAADKRKKQRHSVGGDGGGRVGWLLPLLLCAAVAIILTLHTNSRLAASEEGMRQTIALLEAKLRTVATESAKQYEAAAAAAAVNSDSQKSESENGSVLPSVSALAEAVGAKIEADVSAQLSPIRDGLSDANKRIDALLATAAEHNNKKKDRDSDTPEDGKVKAVAAAADGPESIPAAVRALIGGLHQKVETLEARLLAAAAAKPTHIAAAVAAGGVVSDDAAAAVEAALAPRLEALQRGIEQAHLAIKDANDRTALYGQVEASMRELRRIVGMPELGQSTSEADKEQQRVLAEIADRQAQHDLKGGGGGGLHHPIRGEPQQHHHQHYRPPAVSQPAVEGGHERGQFVRDIMAENYHLIKDQEALRQQRMQQYNQRQQQGSSSNKLPFEEEEDSSDVDLGGQRHHHQQQQQHGGSTHHDAQPNHQKQYRRLHPEDSHYDQYNQRYGHNENKDSARPPAGLVHAGNGPYGVFMPGQTRLPVHNPVADIVDPLRRSVRQAEIIKEEMSGAWQAYKRYAWGHDELKPVSNTYHDWGGDSSRGSALTAVDSLSTFWLMGMHAEFDEAMRLVTEEVDYNQNIRVSVFEYTIRVVGGLLSAYELSGEQFPRLLDTAKLVMDKLLVSYNTSTGLPHQTVNMRNKKHWSSDWSHGAAILSELGTVQLELRTLSYHTKDPTYDIKATHITDLMEAGCRRLDGLCPTFFDTNNAQPRNDQITIGALGDSYYEYLLKQYILTGRTEERYKRLALEALDSAIDKLLQYSSQGRQTYFADIIDGMHEMKMDHLACFAGGMYALAADTFPRHSLIKTYRKVAEGITATCNAMYEKQLSGLSPEFVVFTGGMDFTNGEPYNILRPETVESLFYMWRYTKEQKYRDMAWEIFLRFMAHCKTPSGGYSGVQIVTMVPPEHDDMMQSFFLSETLKYLYLIFSEDSVLDLNEWVLNTEAHPLKIRHRDPMDIWREWELANGGRPAFMPPSVPGVKVRTETPRMTEVRGKDPILPKHDPLGFDEEPPGESDGYRGEYHDHNGRHY